MVNFSDLVVTTEDEEDLVLSEAQIASVLSDTQILRVRGQKVSSAPTRKMESSPEVSTYYEQLVGRAIDIRDQVGNDQKISLSPIFSDLHSILNKDLTGKLYEYAMLAHADYEEMLIHSVKVTLISLIVAKEMRYDIKMLLKLGLAALLENVGMYKIPESVLQKKDRLNENELSMIREHPKFSYEILSEIGEKYQWLAEVALQVHERSDGSGYPQGLSGREIYDLSCIIGLVDMYVAMTSDRPYRDKFVQTDAIKYIIEQGKELFPARLRKAFLNQISLFPVNTYVRLNNDSIGRVLSTNKDQPLRPTIELLYDTAGIKLERPEVIRLPENPFLYITESIDEKHVSLREDP